MGEFMDCRPGNQFAQMEQQDIMRVLREWLMQTLHFHDQWLGENARSPISPSDCV
jgi:hypothetical protein